MTKTPALLLALLLVPAAIGHGTDPLVEPFTRVIDDGGEAFVYNAVVGPGAPDLQTMDVFETYDENGVPGLMIWNENNEVGANTNAPFRMEMAFTVNGTEYLAVKETTDALVYTMALFSHLRVLNGSVAEDNQQTHNFLPYSAFNGSAGATMDALMWTTYGNGVEGDFSPGGCTATLILCGLPVTFEPGVNTGAVNSGPETTSYTLAGPENLVDIECPDLIGTHGDEITVTCTVSNSRGGPVDVTPAAPGATFEPSNFAVPAGASAEFTMTITADESLTALRILARTAMPLATEAVMDSLVTGSLAAVAAAIEPALRWDGEGGDAFDTQQLDPGQSYSWLITEAGHYHYHDHFYPGLTGGINVGGHESHGEEHFVVDPAMVSTTPVEHVVAIRDQGASDFSTWHLEPEVLTVNVGDVVTWLNDGESPHRIASDAASGHEHVHGDESSGIPGPGILLAGLAIALIAIRRRPL